VMQDAEEPNSESMPKVHIIHLVYFWICSNRHPPRWEFHPESYLDSCSKNRQTYNVHSTTSRTFPV
jgi:hypothetical protein